MLTVKKFNYFRFSIFIIVIIAIIVGIILLINHINYTKSNEYKLLNIGYSLDEISILESKLSEKELDTILNREYNSLLVSLINEKYFIFENLDKYIEYKNNNKKYDLDKVIAIINTEANIDWFDNEKETDTSKGSLMLVNRLYGLSKDYVVEDIVDVPEKYAYKGKKISKSILDSIISLADAASEKGYTFVVSDAYRSYEEQEKLYNSYASSYGKSSADQIVARPGHSEYETGLSFDFVPYNKSYDNPKLSEEYLWLRDNAYKYGFIFRFDKDKEYITGFREYTWRLRYVGNESALIMHNENICFEEYYSYYIRREKK